MIIQLLMAGVYMIMYLSFEEANFQLHILMGIHNYTFWLTIFIGNFTN
jgi:hypothetical protein